MDSGPDHDGLEVRLGADAPLDAAGAAVRAAALGAGLGADRATRLRATVEELLGEARAREGVGGETDLRVVARRDGDRFVVELHDRRLPIAPGGGRSLPSRRLAALGFVDHLHVASEGAEGNVARVEVHLVDPDSDALGGDVLGQDAPRLDDATAGSLELRTAQPEDAVGISRCVYRCYGYSYLDPAMYRPSTLRAWMRSGHLHPVVAVLPDGEVVGHCALTFDRSGSAVPEAGKLVVDPRLRGRHLADRLATLRLEVARGLSVPGIWSECVTNHPYSQKEVAALGGVETGLLLGATPASITMEGLENDAGGRHSLLVMWTAVAGTDRSALHVHPRHRELLAGMVERSGQDREVLDGVREPPDAHSHLASSGDAVSGDGSVLVRRIGADLAARVEHELDALAAYDLGVVTVDLPLADPAAPWAVEQLERLRCSFGAWLPGHRGPAGDVLRLQRVAERPLAMDIRCARPEGEAVRDAVLAEWRRVTR